MTPLLRAVRALAGLDPAALDEVTPDAMRAVMLARGWRHDRDVPWFADRAQTVFEEWEHDTAHGEGCRGFGPRVAPAVRVCVLAGIEAAETRRYASEWAWAVATRHGDVAPAEVLAEALAEALAAKGEDHG